MKYRIIMNGKEYEMEIERIDGDVLVASPQKKVAPHAAPAAVESKVSSGKDTNVSSAGNGRVNSPMPGTILKIIAAEGTKVNAGQLVLVLEAMKMENEIAAPASGTVINLAVKEGQTVAGGDLLFEIQ